MRSLFREVLQVPLPEDHPLEGAEQKPVEAPSEPIAKPAEEPTQQTSQEQ